MVMMPSVFPWLSWPLVCLLGELSILVLIPLQLGLFVLLLSFKMTDGGFCIRSFNFDDI